MPAGRNAPPGGTQGRSASPSLSPIDSWPHGGPERLATCPSPQLVSSRVGTNFRRSGSRPDVRSGEVKWSEVAQTCPTRSDPMDCSLPDSSVHGIFQARILEWVAISFSRGSSQPRNRIRVSRIVDRRFTVWTTRGVQDQTCLIRFMCTFHPVSSPS